MTETRLLLERLQTIRTHLRTGAVGQREVWEEWLAEAADEIKRLNIRIRQDAEAALQHLNEIDQLTGAKNALQVEIDRLRALNDDQQKIMDGTERRECEYLALIEKKHDEIERLKGNLEILSHDYDELLELSQARQAAVKAAEQMLYESGLRLGEAHKEISQLRAEIELVSK